MSIQNFKLCEWYNKDLLAHALQLNNVNVKNDVI